MKIEETHVLIRTNRKLLMEERKIINYAVKNRSGRIMEKNSERKLKICKKTRSNCSTNKLKREDKAIERQRPIILIFCRVN